MDKMKSFTWCDIEEVYIAEYENGQIEKIRDEEGVDATVPKIEV